MCPYRLGFDLGRKKVVLSVVCFVLVSFFFLFFLWVLL